MTLDYAPDYLTKCMRRCQLRTQEEPKPNNSSNHDITGQPGDGMLRDMYETVQSVEEQKILGIMPQDSSNPYLLQNAPGNIYPWISALSQLIRKGTMPH